MPRSHGGPFGDAVLRCGPAHLVKDCFDLAGSPTTCGVRFCRDLNGAPQAIPGWWSNCAPPAP